ncbi:Z1 domain-containing protein [Nocardia sp. NPDC059246]|uniref:Z1 domain-containing protein n=1 Tax=unclassified Nocardia TaxID=2637762 RepID=UPI00368549D2
MGHPNQNWANVFEQLLNIMLGSGPRPLVPLLANLSGTEVTAEVVASFIRNAEVNEPALVRLRQAFIHWDNIDDDALLGTASERTASHSRERRQSVYAALDLDDALASVIEGKIPVYPKHFTTISKQCEPWFHAVRHIRKSVYWDGYERYLRSTKEWPDNAIAALDQATTEVIAHLSDPTSTRGEQTKGLVVGYVQSGKTAHFNGVIAKAIDVGYPLIIVLTGTVEILRAQTQRRIDMELIGVENILGIRSPEPRYPRTSIEYSTDDDWKGDRFLRHGTALEDENVSYIDRVTTYVSDYKLPLTGSTQFKFHKVHKKERLNHPGNLFRADAYVAVIKKNPAPLSQLIEGIKRIPGDLADLPMLIIDDESDQASIDTNPEEGKRTRINELITGLLEICPRAQYIGYTATPFASVFIDPNDSHDIFPSDFVLSLDRPDGYMGLQEFHDIDEDADGQERTFANSNKKAHVRLPKEGQSLGRQDLREALDAWVLSGAIKLFRKSKATTDKARAVFRHHTMLVHESTSTAVHSTIARNVRTAWNANDYGSADASARLRALYERDHLRVMEARAAGHVVPVDFDELEPFLHTALIQIPGNPLLIVNSDDAVQKQQKKLNFATGEVWRILVGGTQLSRGFTVEGLTVSYFRRRTNQSDTLMQAGRWFGFRSGYQDLVRLYIDTEVYEDFEALLIDEEAFRERIRNLGGLGEDGLPIIEPEHIPLLVDQHRLRLKPTSRPKMRNAVIYFEAPPGGFKDCYGLPERGADANKTNLFDVGIPLLATATHEVRLPYASPDLGTGQVTAKVGTIGADDFLRLFDTFQWHDNYYDEIERLNRFLLDATTRGRIAEWAVVWPQPATFVEKVAFEELDRPAPIITRSRRPRRIGFTGSDAKHRAAIAPIARGEAGIASLPEAEGRGVVLTYLVDDRPGKPGDKSGRLIHDDIVPLLSLTIPRSARPRKGGVITWVGPARRPPSTDIVGL